MQQLQESQKSHYIARKIFLQYLCTIKFFMFKVILVNYFRILFKIRKCLIGLIIILIGFFRFQYILFEQSSFLTKICDVVSDRSHRWIRHANLFSDPALIVVNGIWSVFCTELTEIVNGIVPACSSHDAQSGESFQ